jgi:hypothetical protein
MAAHSYAEFYGRSNLVDPYGGDYLAVYKAYEPPGPPDSRELLQKFGMVDDYSVFVCLGEDNLVHLFHRLAHHTSSLGVSTSASDNRVIAIQGDVTLVGANHVTVPEAFFNTVDVADVPMAESITTGFTDNPACQQLPSQPEGDRFSTRRAMLVPPPYVSALFAGWAGGPISPRCLWSIAEVAHNSPTHSVSCRVFVDWCRVVASGGVGNENPLRSTTTTGFPTVTLVDASLGKGRAVLAHADFPPQSTVASMPMQPLVVDMIDSHLPRKGSGHYPAIDSSRMRYRLRMVVASVLGTCAFILLIVTASTRSFLSVYVHTVSTDSRQRGRYVGGSGEEFVGVFYPDDWFGKWADPYNKFGNEHDSLRTASRVFLSLALVMGLVSVGLMWYAVWRLCRMPVSVSTHGTASKEVARIWSVATIAAALCALTGALVLLLFGADDCSPVGVSSQLDEFTTFHAHADGCRAEIGSYLLIASVLLWIFLVALRRCVAPMYRAGSDVSGKGVMDSEGDVTDASPEIREQRV